MKALQPKKAGTNLLASVRIHASPILLCDALNKIFDALLEATVAVCDIEAVDLRTWEASID